MRRMSAAFVAACSLPLVNAASAQETMPPNARYAADLSIGAFNQAWGWCGEYFVSKVVAPEAEQRGSAPVLPPPGTEPGQVIGFYQLYGIYRNIVPVRVDDVARLHGIREAYAVEYRTKAYRTWDYRFQRQWSQWNLGRSYEQGNILVMRSHVTFDQSGNPKPTTASFVFASGMLQRASCDEVPPG